MADTYELVTRKGQQGIKCLVCGLTSYNENDIREKFCGKCNEYHEYPFLSSEP